MRNKPKIIERKLGREKAAGQCYPDKNLIEIDPRQSPKEYLDTITHESLHLSFPLLTEKEINRVSRLISGILWKSGFRREVLTSN
jgi:hypothetical protein